VVAPPFGGKIRQRAQAGSYGVDGWMNGLRGLALGGSAQCRD
jgi:hypothetical protein